MVNELHDRNLGGVVMQNVWSRLMDDIKKNNPDTLNQLFHILHQNACPADFYFDDYFMCERYTCDEVCRECWLYRGDINAANNQNK